MLRACRECGKNISVFSNSEFCERCYDLIISGEKTVYIKKPNIYLNELKKRFLNKLDLTNKSDFEKKWIYTALIAIVEGLRYFIYIPDTENKEIKITQLFNNPSNVLIDSYTKTLLIFFLSLSLHNKNNANHIKNLYKDLRSFEIKIFEFFNFNQDLISSYYHFYDQVTNEINNGEDFTESDIAILDVFLELNKVDNKEEILLDFNSIIYLKDAILVPAYNFFIDLMRKSNKVDVSWYWKRFYNPK